MNLRRLAGIARRLDRAPEVLACARRARGWARLTAAYLGARALSFPHWVELRDGTALRLETFHDLVTAWIIFFRDEYDVDPSARVIVDAGANIGAFSLYAARAAPGARIVALEPFPATLARLRETIRANRLEGRVVCRDVALAGASERRRLDDDPSLPSQSRGLSASETGVVVEALTLGDLLEREGLERVDLLKIDIEGGEHEVFLEAPSAVLARIERVAMEYHPNASKRPLFARLEAEGLRLVRDVVDAPDSGVAHFERRA